MASSMSGMRVMALPSWGTAFRFPKGASCQSQGRRRFFRQRFGPFRVDQGLRLVGGTSRRTPQRLDQCPTSGVQFRPGWGLCPEHQQRFTQGYIALVECDPKRSRRAKDPDRLKPEQAYRTGRVAHVKREVFARVFNVQLALHQPCVFVEPGVIERLRAMTEPAAG